MVKYLKKLSIIVLIALTLAGGVSAMGTDVKQGSGLCRDIDHISRDDSADERFYQRRLDAEAKVLNK